MKRVSWTVAAGAALVAAFAAPERAAANPSVTPTVTPSATPSATHHARRKAVPTTSALPNALGGLCAKPQGLPNVRVSNRLTVESPPRAKPERWLRLRTHRSAPELHGQTYWEGPEVPLFVPLALGALELELLDPIPGGYMALYADKPYNGARNGSYEVRLFSCGGQMLAKVPLNPLFSRRDQLEVQDIRYADGTLYFNEACQTYSREAGGRCSALVAVNPLTRRVLWRTPPLTSNSVIRVVGDHIVVGYGFTNESDYVRIVRRSDGRVVEKKPLPSSHFELEVHGDVLDVEVGGTWVSFLMSGLSTATPHLTPLGSYPAQSASTTTQSPPSRAAGPAVTQPMPKNFPKLPPLPVARVRHR